MGRLSHPPLRRRLGESHPCPPLLFSFACACAQSQSLSRRKCHPDQGTTGYDTQPVVFWDPPCQCYSWYTRFKNEPPRPAPWLRMVRRLRAKNLDANEGKGEWNMQPCLSDPQMCQRVVMRADAIDNATHSMGAEWKIPPLDYYVRVAPAAFWACLRPVLIPKVPPASGRNSVVCRPRRWLRGVHDGGCAVLALRPKLPRPRQL